MKDAIRLLEEIQKSLDSYERRPASRFEAAVSYNRKPDCTCGVCGDEVAFGESNIVDGDNFEYDQWDTEALHEMHEPLEQDRICRRCEHEFVQNGGRFDQYRYAGYEECETCHGTGDIVDDSSEVPGVVECPDCGGTGAIESE